METKRLKAAVAELTAILQEMQEEVKMYDKKKSAWYWNQLEQCYSGLCTLKEFDKETFDKYQKLYSNFYLGDVISRIEGLEKTFEFFKENVKMLDKFVSEAKNRVPEDWKHWEVAYNDSQCAVTQHGYFYAPTGGHAAEMCKKKYTYEHNTIVIVEVKEIKK